MKKTISVMADQGRDPASESVSENNRGSILEAGPIQPVLEFPSTYSGNKCLKFQAAWYSQFPWLEYSMTKDAAFSYHWRCFGTSGECNMRKFSNTLASIKT